MDIQVTEQLELRFIFGMCPDSAWGLGALTVVALVRPGGESNQPNDEAALIRCRPSGRATPCPADAKSFLKSHCTDPRFGASRASANPPMLSVKEVAIPATLAPGRGSNVNARCSPMFRIKASDGPGRHFRPRRHQIATATREPTLSSNCTGLVEKLT